MGIDVGVWAGTGGLQRGLGCAAPGELDDGGVQDESRRSAWSLTQVSPRALAKWSSTEK